MPTSPLSRRRFLPAAGGPGVALASAGCGVVDLSAEQGGGNLLDRRNTAFATSGAAPVSSPRWST
ncbi:hypothetical protein [Saccharothrix australiensis]|uniref:Uncharacterized protein n=1 Tax=Saccharothrix australiensis TaxID=2072 RepID=A0A495W0D6_9PSEU|nr:hypothetical protein [Saccharothrix australiensis]RKT55161.1 hypothetical protein C8E97_3819 [Saccharothrix australiensis]